MQPSQLKKPYLSQGEFKQCKLCPLQLACFMKRPSMAMHWCYRCNGWVLKSLKLIVQCMWYKPIMPYDEYIKYWALYCPNCSPTSKIKDTYIIIRPGLDTNKHIDFANKK
jgi:hypothetical protein